MSSNHDLWGGPAWAFQSKQNAIYDLFNFEEPEDGIILQGRLSTVTEAGSALAIPSTYTYGEAIELRYTSSKSNAQFQGMFLEVRTAVANTSTIRGFEVTAAQEGAVAVGTLEGGSGKAITRSATTGNITNMFGLTGETTHNSDAYTGTVTNLAAVRGKVSLEDGATYTNSSVFLAETEPITGAETIGSILRVDSHANITVTQVFDLDDVVSANLFKVAASGDGGVTVGSDAMNGNPETDTEAGYITFLVGATAYQIPFYPAS